MRIFQPTVTGSNTTTGSLHISGPVYFYTLEDTPVTHILVYDTESGQVHYTASSQVGTLTNPAPSDTYIQYNSSSKFGADQYFRYIYTSRSLQHGENVIALGISSHAQGNSTNAIGQYSHTEGSSTYTGTLTGYSASIASGVVTLWDNYDDETAYFSSGDYLWFTDDDNPVLYLIDSVTYSFPNTIITLVDTSVNSSGGVVGNANLHPSQWFGDQKMGASHAHAEGEATHALGVGAHAEGSEATAIGNWSHAAGQRTLALGLTQFVVGQYNKPSISQSAFIIGDGTTDNDRHNVLFVSKSHFEVSASNTYLQGLPISQETHVLVYNTSSGQVYYTSSNTIGGNGTPSPPLNSIQFNGDGAFSGSTNLTYLSASSELYLTGSMFVSGTISASYGSNTIGFYGTSSWAIQAITSSYPINVTGSSLYSVAPKAGIPNEDSINNIFFGEDAGYNLINIDYSNFIGYRAGYVASYAAYSNFIGSRAGYDATNAQYSNFIGYSAGEDATEAISSNFIGGDAGKGAIRASYSNFIGNYAGSDAVSASYSNFIGISAGSSATKASGSNFIGQQAGGSAVSASFSNFIGFKAGNYAFSASNSILIGSKVGSNPYTFSNYSIGPNNIILGTNITLPPLSQDSINIGGIIFATGSNSDTTSVFPIHTPVDGKIGINIYPPLYNLHASGSISFPSLTSVPQVNVVVIDTASGQLFYLPTGSVGGGGVTINNNNSNYLITATGTSNTLEGEANLQFDGSTLTVIGNILANSITGSFTGSLTGSLYGTASWAESASFALTAAAAPEDTWIQYNKEGLFSATGSFRFIYTSQSFQHGNSTLATGSFSHSEGSGSIASGFASHAEGYKNEARGAYSHAEGGGSGLAGFPLDGNIASGPGSHAEGGKTAATNTGSHSEGYETIAGGIGSHAEGYLTLASGQFSHAEGDDSTASGYGSHAEGRVTVASQIGAHSEGYYTLASGDSSHAEGSRTTASGLASHVEGSGSIAIGQFSHAEGENTQAQGDISHTEGSSSIASGKGAHAEGFSTTAFGDYSHAEGSGSYAGSLASHAEGFFTSTNGNFSHAEGSGSIANGDFSHAEGQQTKTEGPYQLTIGQFNSTNISPSAFIIGNGTSDANRSNLLFASGSNIEISGSLYVTSSLITEGSRVRKYREITLTNSDIGDPPTYSIEEDDDIILIIDTTNTIPAASDGTLSVTNFLANSPAGRCVEIVTTEAGTAGTILYIAAGMGGTSNLMLNRVSMTNSVRKVNNAVGESVTLMAMGLAKTGSIWGNGW